MTWVKNEQVININEISEEQIVVIIGWENLLIYLIPSTNKIDWNIPAITATTENITSYLMEIMFNSFFFCFYKIECFIKPKNNNKIEVAIEQRNLTYIYNLILNIYFKF